MKLIQLACIASLSIGAPTSQDRDPSAPVTDRAALQEAQARLLALLAERGVVLEESLGLCAIPSRIGVTNDYLEYLLVARHGAVHESMFVTDVDAELLNTALLALGVSPGRNASWAPKDPAPGEEEIRQGVSPYVVEPPSGDGFYLYAAWREGDELYCHRIEDLVRDLATGRTMKRHRWVYLGSRMVPFERGGEERFAAAVEGNLINIAFFTAGNTLLTAGLEACVEQTIWLANPWMLPAFESPVLMIFARERLTALPPSLDKHVPELVANPLPRSDSR